MKRVVFLSIIIISGILIFANPAKTTKSKTVGNKSKSVPGVTAHKLPLDIFLKLIDSTDLFVINHATQFRHIDLPKRMFDTFNSYIKDSVAAEVPGLKSFVYYDYTLFDGRIIIGDIYWNDQASYIVFKIYDKKYVNYFTRDGVQQLKTLFKL